MTPINFTDLLNDLNSGWPQHFTAEFYTAIGYHETEAGLEETYNYPQAHIGVKQRTNVNHPYRRSVMIRDIKTGGSSDEYNVHIVMNQGVYKSAGEDIGEQVNQYAQDRLNELKTFATHLSKDPSEYPIEWKATVTKLDDSGSEWDVYIYGVTSIPVTDVGDDRLELGDISKLLVGTFHLVEHPNHHDSYLALNRLGYCNDSWSVPNVE